MSVRHPYSPSGSGRLFGLLTAAVIVVPIAVVAFVLFELDILTDNDKSPATEGAAAETESFADIPDPLEALGGAELLPPDEELDPGLSVQAPSPQVVHIIVAGDTVSSIARAFGVSIADILAANDIPDPNVLLVGQEIIIPLAVLTANSDPGVTVEQDLVAPLPVEDTALTTDTALPPADPAPPAQEIPLAEPPPSAEPPLEDPQPGAGEDGIGVTQ